MLDAKKMKKKKARGESNAIANHFVFEKFDNFNDLFEDNETELPRWFCQIWWIFAIHYWKNIVRLRP